MTTPDDYEVRAERASISPRFGWSGLLMHLPSDTIVDQTYGPDESTVRNLMERRRFERTRPPATTVSFYGSGTVHLAFVDPDVDTIPYHPYNPDDIEDRWRAVRSDYDGTTLCTIPVTPRTVLTNTAPNCTACRRRLVYLVEQGAAS